MTTQRIFISHNHNDDGFVDRLARDLQAHKLKTFMDHADIRGAARWNEHVQRALEDCQQMVAVVSERSVASKNCQDEWHTFMDDSKEIIPAWIGGKMYFSFASAIRVDFRDKGAYDRALTELIGLLTDDQTQLIPSEAPHTGHTKPAKGRPPHENHSQPLPPSLGALYPLLRRPEKSIGIATGNIGKIGGADVLTNTENNFLDMDRPTGKTISGAINAFSADWDEHDRLVRQTVKDELDALARQVDIPVKLGVVFVTSPGNLASNNVRYVVHTISVERHRDEFITGTRVQLERCVTNALLTVDGLTRDRCPDAPLRRVVLPLLGTGAGGLPAEEIVPLLIERAIDYLETIEDTAIETVYFLAYGPQALEKLRTALDNCPDLDTPHDPA